jgi:hypothetical protein
MLARMNWRKTGVRKRLWGLGIRHACPRRRSRWLDGYEAMLGNSNVRFYVGGRMGILERELERVIGLRSMCVWLEGHGQVYDLDTSG